ncbi:hypothetical protein M0R01_04615 [bacterium]|jgi:hypothetical protein|nr:hypothetical protein [bacterium]
MVELRPQTLIESLGISRERAEQLLLILNEAMNKVTKIETIEILVTKLIGNELYFMLMEFGARIKTQELSQSKMMEKLIIDNGSIAEA